MNIALWILQVLLAVVFALHGWLYVTWSPARVETMRKRRPNAKPSTIAPWFRTFIGVAEILAAAGLLLPDLTGILLWLTPLTGAGLTITMIGAVVYHAARQETQSVLVTGVLLLSVAFVTWMRWQVMPL